MMTTPTAGPIAWSGGWCSSIERAGVNTYIGLDGVTVDIKIEQIVKIESLPVSIMPEGLVLGLSDLQLRDLLAWLQARRE